MGTNGRLRAYSLACAWLVASCAAREHAISGAFLDNSEKLQGTVTDDGLDSVLTMTTEKGVTCRSDITYLGHRIGSGVVHCSDDATGTIDVLYQRSKGIARGKIKDREYTFVF